MKNKITRIIVGSVLAMLSITLIAVLIQWIFGIGDDFQVVTTLALAMAMVAPLVSGVFFLIWGVPIHFVLLKFNRAGVWWYAAAGFLPAIVFVFGFKPMGNDPIMALLYQSAYLGVIGAIGAIVFWFYVIKNDS